MPIVKLISNHTSFMDVGAMKFAARGHASLENTKKYLGDGYHAVLGLEIITGRS